MQDHDYNDLDVLANANYTSGPVTGNPLKFLIVGTGRCGSVYMAKLLTSLGIPCGHESYFTVESQIPFEFKPPRLSFVSMTDLLNHKDLGRWVDPETIVADSSYMAVPFLNEPLVKDIPVVHLVRNPLKVISSFMSVSDFYGDPNKWKVHSKFKQRYLPEIVNHKTGLARICLYWLEWNRIIMQKLSESDRPHIIHQVEVGPSKFLLDFLGVKELPEKVFNNVYANKWSIRPRDITVNQMPAFIRNQIVELAAELGYPNLSTMTTY